MHRLYENEDITVFWDSNKCRHAKICVNGCPEVFEFTRKPWIILENGENKDIWQTVEKCPSGALTITYNRKVNITLEKDNHRSVAIHNGVMIGECDFEITPDGWNIYHTEVNPSFGGKNIAKRLAYKVLEAAEKEKANVIPSCSYVRKLITD